MTGQMDLIHAILEHRQRGMYPAYRMQGGGGAEEASAVPAAPAAPLELQDQNPTMDAEPLDLANRFVDHQAGDAEPEPSFVRHPALAGFLAGLAGGEEGIRTLMAAKNAYYSRMMRQQQETSQLDERRNEAALRYMDPTMAASPDVATSIRQRKLEQENAPVPEGYVRNPLKPGQLLREPKPTTPPKKERPIAVAPSHTLVERDENGQFKPVYTAPALPGKGPGARKPSDEARDRDFVEKSIARIDKLRSDSVDYNAQMRSINAKGVTGMDKFDPSTGMTFRQLYRALKEKNNAARQEINRLWGQVHRVQGTEAPRSRKPVASSETPPAGTAAPAVQPTTTGEVQGYTKADIEALRSAMSEDDRDEFDSYPPDRKKKVLDAAYGRD